MDCPRGSTMKVLFWLLGGAPFMGQIAIGAVVLPACSNPTYLPREKLLDPQTCATCHEGYVRDWSGSMHAYASDDPVFVAMNARGQRETKGALGNFCVN